MSTTPPASVTFDFTKAVPVDAGAAIPKSASGAPATAVPVPSKIPAGVTFDFTKAEPVAGPGEQIGYSGLKDIVPMEGEDFADTMKRAIAYGKTLTQADIDRQTKADAKLAPYVAAAAPVIGAAGAGAIAGTSAVFGPETTVAAARDALGRFTGGTLEREGASMATQLLQKFGPAAAQWLVKHAAQSILTGAAGGATWALINHLSKVAEP